jgi:hypothetical protein
MIFLPMIPFGSARRTPSTRPLGLLRCLGLVRERFRPRVSCPPVSPSSTAVRWTLGCPWE